MNRIYFQDTDTLLFEFGDTYVVAPLTTSTSTTKRCSSSTARAIWSP